jgi:hypothetical protein
VLARTIRDATTSRTEATIWARRRRPLLIAACLTAAVALVAAVLAVARSEPSRVSTPIATTPGITEPPVVAPAPVSACGSDLPIALGRLDGFNGPAPGPGAHSVTPAADDQLVYHWTSATGSIEVRWPIDANAGIVITEPGPTGSGSTSAQQSPDTNGFYLHRTVVRAGPESPLSCRLVQIDVRDTDSARAEANTTLVYRTMFPSPPLITGSENHDEIPTAVACATPPGVEPTPNRGGPVNRAAFPTPEDALEDFIATEPTLAQHGYTEWRASNGRHVYVQAQPGGDGYVTVIHVATTPDGNWTVVAFDASGC